MTADLTYGWTDEVWLYLAVVLDLFNREVVGWSIKPRLITDIVVDASQPSAYLTAVRS